MQSFHDITNMLTERDDLQTHINEKSGIGLFNFDITNMFGLPDYLLNAKIIHKDDPFHTPFKHYERIYRPDCICEYDQIRYVIELKRANKYEPLGIAEVLFNTDCQKRNNLKATIIPILFSSFNMWNRVVIQQLREANIDFRYFEIYVLSEQSDRSKRNDSLEQTDVIWFYDPFLKGRNWENPFEDAEEINNHKRITYNYNKKYNKDEYIIEPI
jgi:hypothetical protein